MKMSEEQRVTLLSKLEAKGWFWKGEFIYAPCETIWLRGSDPWMNDLSEFHTRMSARLGRLLKSKASYPGIRQYNEIVCDNTILVYVLRWLK